MSGIKREAMCLPSGYTAVPAERKVYTFGFKSIYLFSERYIPIVVNLYTFWGAGSVPLNRCCEA